MRQATETCLISDGANYYDRYGMGGRSVDEALAVLIPLTSHWAANECTGANWDLLLLGDCCGVSQSKAIQASDLVSTPFFAQVDGDLCTACGVCETRCQMEAISLDDGVCMIKTERCIGCGLCVTTCVTMLSLQRASLPPCHVPTWTLLYLAERC
jgi:NAD-dependent dihydropyrimidine dehydrogenase PreA subunit